MVDDLRQHLLQVELEQRRIVFDLRLQPEDK